MSLDSEVYANIRVVGSEYKCVFRVPEVGRIHANSRFRSVSEPL